MSKSIRRFSSVLLTLFVFLTILPMGAVCESYEDDPTIQDPWNEDAGHETRDPSEDGQQTDPETPPVTGEGDEPSGSSINPEHKEENDERHEERPREDMAAGDAPITGEEPLSEGIPPIQSVEVNAVISYSIQVDWLSGASLYAPDSLWVEIIGRRANGQDVIGRLALTADMGWKDVVDLPVYAYAGGAEPELYTAYGLVVASGQEGLVCSVHLSGTAFIVSVTGNADTALADTAPMTPHEEDEDAEFLIEKELGGETDMPEIPTPMIRLAVDFAGETMTKGTPVTITATIEGIPDGMHYMLQWRNDASGQFQDVPGETGMSVTFAADEWNVNCSWQLVVRMIMPEVEV